MDFFQKTSKKKLIEKLHALSRTAESSLHRSECQKVCEFYIRNGFIPSNLIKRCIDLVDINKPAKPVELDNFYLYAISTQDQVKVGYSKNPKTRLKTLQTGSSSDLSLEWYKYCASSDKEARIQERILHRKIKRFKIRGEWFHKSALALIYPHRVKNQESKEDAAAELLNRSMDNAYYSIIG